MAELLENVVAAMLAEFERQGRDEPSTVDSAGSAGHRGKAALYGEFDLELVAGAMLRAIREPTDHMKRIGERSVDPYGANLTPSAEHSWRAMIDAALSERPKSPEA